MKTNKIILSVLAVIVSLALIAGLAACKGKKTGDSQFKYGKVDIPGKDGGLCSAPIYIALEKGFYAEEGFDVTLISSDPENNKINLNNGTIPVINSDFVFFPSIEEGINIKIVDGLHKGCIKFAVRPDSDIKTVQDFKGKKIGIDVVGGSPHQVASMWLENAGISAKPENREVQFLPFSDGNLELEALLSGAIDVAGLWDPFGSVSEKAGKVKIVFDLTTDPFFADHYCCFLYASSKVIKENPEKVAALLRAYRKAQDWIANNPKEAVDIISDKKYSAIEDKELAAELISHYQYPNAHQHGTRGFNIEEDVKYFAQALYNIGYLKTQPDQFVKDAFYKVDLNLGK
jgi:NitT/TauT family transport system substrate-binding protein